MSIKPRSIQMIVGLLSLLVIGLACAQGKIAETTLPYACQPGMFILTDNITICPENCADPTDFPGYDEKKPASFSRNQDTVGMCTTFSAADYICHELKQLILPWPPQTANFSKGCSAVDLEIQAFAEENRDKNKNTISQFLRHFDDKGHLSSTDLMHSLTDFVRIAKLKGVCAENSMPSEFLTKDGGGLRALYGKLKDRFAQYKQSTQAGVSLIGLCPECNAIAPGLTENQWNQIKQVLDSVKDLSKSDFQILKKIDDIACPTEKRIKLPADFMVEQGGEYELQRQLAKPGKIAVLKVDAHALAPDNVPADDDTHMLIAYSTEIRRVEGKQICYYAIKNSWGPDACKNRLPDIQCDPKNGTFFVSDELLRKITRVIQW
jgi:hypothetical protein